MRPSDLLGVDAGEGWARLLFDAGVAFAVDFEQAEEVAELRRGSKGLFPFPVVMVGG